jgi:hypothetical protein
MLEWKGRVLMEHISYIVIALAMASFVFVCLNWPRDKRA